MDDKKIEELINKALRQDLSLPEGLSDKLEHRIDSLAKERKSDVKRPFIRKSLWVGGSGIAAAILCAALLIFTDTSRSDGRLADTYNDPREAAIAAQNALALMSSNLNKGFAQMNEAQKEIHKINKIVNKHLNDE